ncbi:MAG: hypothetical protein ACPGVO_21830 [Spirulinaceae cyanobacterium]
MAVSTLIDNDIFLKLAVCDVLEAAFELFSVTSEEVGILGTLPFIIDSKKIQNKYNPEEREKLRLATQSFLKIQTPTSGYFQSLQMNPAIDIGEASLIATAIELEGSLIWTGDKRCLQALYNNSELKNIHKLLQGRVICLEQIIAKLIQNKDFTSI